jgi:O-antigen/teichoic acid export membrane protein
MLASAFSALFGLLSAVVFTRVLSPGEYGVYVVGVTTAGIFSAILFTWVRLSALRFQSEGGTVDIRATVFLAYLISLCALPVLIVAAAPFSGYSLERGLGAALFTSGLGLFELGQEVLKARIQIRWFLVGTMVRSAAAFALCLLAASLGGGGLGQLVMAALAYFVAAGLVARAVWSRPIAPLNPPLLKTFLWYGAPITVSGFVYAIHAGLDRLFIAYLLGDGAAGLYGAPADFVRQIILVPATSVAAATIPLAIRALAAGGRGAARAHLESGAELLFAILLPGVVGLALTSPYVAAVVLGPSFRQAAVTIMPILAFAWLFQSISQSYIHISFHLAKKPQLVIVQSVGTLAANAAALPLLVVKFGLPGAAAALVLAEAFGVLLGFWLTRRAHPLPLVPSRLLRVVLATSLMALAIVGLRSLLNGNGPASLAILVGAGVATYAVAACLLNIAGVGKYVQALFGKRLAADSGAI